MPDEHWSKKLIQTISTLLHAMKQAIFQKCSNCHSQSVLATTVYETFENFIGILSCDQGLTLDALLKYIQDILLRCNMDTKKLVGTAFDGASSVVRLAEFLKQNFGDNIIHIHCFAHCNELAFKDATALSPLIVNICMF